MQTVSSVELLVKNILRCVPDESRLRFAHVAAAPRVQRRVAGAERSDLLIGEAREIRERDGTPFWHALFFAGEAKSDGVPLAILQSALYHQQPEEFSVREIVLDGEAPSRIASLAQSLTGRDSLALESRIVTPDGDERFLLMLDFSVKSARPGGERTAIACMEALGVPGALFASGRSYHFYGSQLATEEEQRDFWARALLLTPIVDERWIAHQLRAGRAALRVSPNEYGDVPRLVAEYPANGEALERESR